MDTSFSHTGCLRQKITGFWGVTADAGGDCSAVYTASTDHLIAYILFWLQDEWPAFKIGLGASLDLQDEGLYAYYDGYLLYAFRNDTLLDSMAVNESYAWADYLELWVETEGNMGYFYISIVDDEGYVINNQSVGMDLVLLDPLFDTLGDHAYFEIDDPTAADLGMVDYFEAICFPGTSRMFYWVLCDSFSTHFLCWDLSY